MTLLIQALAGAGHLFMAYHAWRGLESYARFWRWLIPLCLILDGANGIETAFTKMR